MELHPPGCVLGERLRGGTGVFANHRAVDQPSDGVCCPLVSVGMIRPTQIRLERVLRVVIRAWVTVNRVALDMAFRADLLEVELVPEGARFFRAVFPQEE